MTIRHRIEGVKLFAAFFAPVVLLLMAQAPADPLIARLSEEAEVFHYNITKVVAEETLEQRALKRQMRFRPRVGAAALEPPPVLWQNRKLVSEYGIAPFKESGGVYHEVRQVKSVDGRVIGKAGEARMSLAKNMVNADDKVRRKLLLEFEKHGLIGTATDFAISLLIFRRDGLKNLEITPAGRDQVGYEEAMRYEFIQRRGESQFTIFQGNETVKQGLRGAVWIRIKDGMPLKMMLLSQFPYDGQVWRDEGVIEYKMSDWGFLLPSRVVHQRTADTKLQTENRFQYAKFQRFAADAEIKFEVADPEKPQP